MAKRIWKYDKKLGEMVEVTRVPVRREIAQWPIHSEAMAIDSEDIPYAQEVLREHGVRTDYDELGCPVLRDRSHRKAHCEALGFYDRDAGYGDASPRYYTSDYRTR